MATLTFDHDNKCIFHLETDTSIQVQDLYNAIKDEEDFLHVAIATPIIGTATGKDDLGGGEFTGITLVLQNGWKMKSLTSPGSPTIIKIAGGNMITSDGSLFFKTVTNIHYDRSASTSPAAISLSAVLTTLTAMQIDVTLIKKVLGNRVKLDNVANTITFYDDDDVTPILVKDVKDFLGAPSVDPQAEVVPQ